MFDIGWQEIFILAVIALIVIGPKDLPSAVRTITSGLRKARSLARDLRDGMDDVVREAEMEDLTNKISGGSIDLTKEFKDVANIDFDDMDIERDLQDTMTGAAKDLKSKTDPEASGNKAKRAKKKAQKIDSPSKRKVSKSGKADG